VSFTPAISIDNVSLEADASAHFEMHYVVMRFSPAASIDNYVSGHYEKRLFARLSRQNGHVRLSKNYCAGKRRSILKARGAGSAPIHRAMDVCGNPQPFFQRCPLQPQDFFGRSHIEADFLRAQAAE
jgi:hypothetical protein